MITNVTFHSAGDYGNNLTQLDLGLIGTGKNVSGDLSEKEIFGKQARWVDYSGPVVVGKGEGRRVVTEGITYFDHPSNPRYPTPWHVREDGWMGASFGMNAGHVITHESPLQLRYLLHVHSGDYDASMADIQFRQFSLRPRKDFSVKVADDFF